MSANVEALRAAASGYTLAALFRRSAALYADRLAVVGGGADRTYRDLDVRSDRLASVLLERNVRRGDRVAVLSTTRPEFIEVYLAAAKLGVTVVGLNFRLHPDELAQCIAMTHPQVLFASPEHVDLLRKIAADERSSSALVFGADASADVSYEAAVAAASDRRIVDVAEPEDIHSVVFTSGTTGRPKAAMISQRAAAMRALRVAHWYELTPEDGMVGWLPLYHTSVETVTATLLSGGRWATFDRIDIAAMYAAIERYRLTWIPLLPGVFTEFMDHPGRGGHDLSSLRFGFGYGNMMPQAVKEFCALFGAGFWDAYGQTESSFLVAHGYVRPGEEPSLRKQPTPLLDLRLVDEDMNDVDVEVPGECVLRGPTLMSGYLDDEAATAEAFRGGWLHTGDVLMRHSDGTVSFIDRVKYLIKTGGENVYPAEVELVIAEHPAVREVCVVSVPDERWGESIKAVVVSHPEAELTADDVRAWCKQRLAGYKCPRLVEFMTSEQLPRSITGKILRDELARLSS
jgi:acyl-CoA synthetase (AMP-forming)/AMP-acid ligase II